MKCNENASNDQKGVIEVGVVVGIELGKAGDLARACAQAGGRMGDQSAHLARLLREAGQDPTTVVPAHEAAEWLITSNRRITALIAAVGSWSSTGGGPDLVWHHGTDAAFGDPGPAFTAADKAIAAHRRGDDEAFERLLGMWADDPVFALRVADHLDVAAVVAWLGAIEDHLGASSSDRDHVRSERLLASLATVLATATTYDLSPFSLAELVDAGQVAGLSRGAVALLFTPGASWATSWLVEAVRLLVVPLTAQLVRDGPQVAYRSVGRELRDVRLPVLAAVSRDPAAARRVLNTVELEGLVRADAAYLDDGRALAEMIRVGSWPPLDLATSERSSARSGVLAFIRAVPIDAPVPPALLDDLGLIVAPYIGAFRADSSKAGRLPAIDAGNPVNPLPALEEIEAREYLDVASASPIATVELRASAAIWTAAALTGSRGSIPVPELLHDIGAVRRFVDEGARGFERALAAGLDATHEHRRQVLGRLAQLPGLFPPTRAVGAAASFTVGLTAPSLAPDGQDELHHLASVPLLIGRNQDVLEWQLLAHLWQRRQTSHVFDDLPPPPAGIVAPDGRLTSPSRFGEEQWLAFKTWRDAVAPHTGVDNLGAAYGRQVPTTTDLSD